jgi:hypothetical protein
MNNHELHAFGWKPFFEQQLAPELLAGTVVAHVSAHYGSQVLMLGAAGQPWHSGIKVPAVACATARHGR